MNKGFQRPSKRTRKTWIKDVYWSQTEHTQQQPWRTPRTTTREQSRYVISFFSNWHLFPGGCSFFGEEGEGGREGDREAECWGTSGLNPTTFFGRGWSPRQGVRAAATGWVINNRVIKAIQAPDKTSQHCSWGSSFRIPWSWLITFRSPVQPVDLPVLSPSMSKGCCTPT